MFRIIQFLNSDIRVYTPGLFRSPHPIPQLIIPAKVYLPLLPLTTRGPPESPSQESAPPFAVPAQRNILGIHSFCPLRRYICMHFSLEIMGKWTSLKIGEIWPYSDRRPQPVTEPVLPTKSELEVGKQIGMTFGWKLTFLTILKTAMSYS